MHCPRLALLPARSFSSPAAVSLTPVSVARPTARFKDEREKERGEGKKKSILLFLSYMNIINPECPALGCSLRFQ